MAVVSIEYKEGDPSSYEHVEVYHRDSSRMLFDTGDFVKDWYNCNKYLLTILHDTDPYISNSSSVNHFIMDGAPFDSMYLLVENKIATLISEYCEDSIEFFVNRGDRPTWQELKDHCELKPLER